MRSLLRATVIAMVATACGIQWKPAWAAECVVGAYETYLFATREAKSPYNRKLWFKCTPEHWEYEARFQADPAGGLSCAGTTPEAIAGPISVRAELFATPGASIWISNGWRIVRYEIADGKFTEIHRRVAGHRRDSLIMFDFKVPGQGTAFKHELMTITFSKPGGVCSNVLAEAFDWSE